VIALPLRARITVDCFVCGFAVHARCFIIRIAHAGSGPLGQHRLDSGAALGVDQAVDAAHPVDALVVDGQMPPPGSFGVGRWLAVLIEQQCQPVSRDSELRGPQLRGNAGQIGLGGVACLVVDKARQTVEELLDDLDVFGP
jgi:hypothetical protein